MTLRHSWTAFAALLAVSSSLQGQVPNWTLSARPIIEIGVVEGDSAYLLSRVQHVLRLRDGTVLVADAAGLRQYDREGTFVRRITAHGRGPGEIRTISALKSDPNRQLYVWDAAARSRLLFDSVGQYVSQVPVLTNFDNPRALSFEFSWLASDSTLVSRTEPAHEPQAGKVERRPLRFVLANLRTGRLVELGVYSAKASFVVSRGTPARHAWQPFSPETHIAIGADRIYIGDSGKPEIVVYSAGDGSLIARLPFRQVPATVRRADFDYALSSRLRAVPASSHPEVRRLWDLAPKPSRFPYYGGFVADTDGNLWVMTYRARPDVASWWTALALTGAELGRLRLPGRFQPMFIDQNYIVGVARDTNDVEIVQVWAYSRRP